MYGQIGSYQSWYVELAKVKLYVLQHVHVFIRFQDYRRRGDQFFKEIFKEQIITKNHVDRLAEKLAKNYHLCIKIHSFYNDILV